MKKWLKINLFLFTGILVVIGGLNYFMDPLWCFSHHHSLQAHQDGFDERQQKLNLIHYHPFKYDGLLLGNSRVTLHNSSLINQAKIFNLAVDAMHPFEYDHFIEYAKKHNGKEFDYIILGFDFLSIEKVDMNYTINTKISNTENMTYPYKSLLTYDSLTHSIRNLRNTALKKYKKRFKTYNEQYIASAYPPPPIQIEQKVSDMSSLYHKPLHYSRDQYLQILKILRQHNPNTRFIIFVSPLPSPMINAVLKESKNHKILQEWSRDLLDIFGPYYNFMTINPITKDYINTFVDSGHYHAKVGNCINEKIFNGQCDLNNSESFGTLITNRNIDSIIEITLKEKKQ